MTLKVVEFKKPDAQKPVVNEKIVEYLRDTLAQAEAGDITTLGIAFVDRDGSINTCYEGHERFTLLGAVHYLGKRITNLIEEQ